MKTENQDPQQEETTKPKTARVSRHVYDVAYDKLMDTCDKVMDAFNDKFERKSLAIENNNSNTD